MRSKSACLALLLFLVFSAVAILLSLQACTAAQMASADKAIGGTPLTSVPTTQPGVMAVPTTQQVFLHFVGDAAGEAAPVVAVAAPQPWGAIAGLALGGIASLIAAYQTVGKNNAQTTIANAAPAIVSAFTPELIAAAPALAALVSHPSAANAIAAMTAASTIGVASNQSSGSKTG